jgi:hypothetical protein
MTGRRSYIKNIKALYEIIRFLSSLVFSVHFFSLINVKCGSGLGFDPEFKEKKGNFLVGYFQSYRFLEDSKRKEEFRSITCNSGNPFYLKILESVKSEPSIMIHVRLGDYVLEKCFGVLGDEYFRRALNEIKGRDLNSRLLMFSDEPEKAIRFFPDTVRERLKLIPSESLTPAETLDIMKNCNKFIISNSTFSWWAAYLSKSVTSGVIYPIPWFTGMNTPDQLIPESWIGVSRT